MGLFDKLKEQISDKTGIDTDSIIDATGQVAEVAGNVKDTAEAVKDTKDMITGAE